MAIWSPGSALLAQEMLSLQDEVATLQKQIEELKAKNGH